MGSGNELQAKEGPLEKYKGKDKGVLGPVSQGLSRTGISGEVPGEDLNRIFISFRGVSF